MRIYHIARQQIWDAAIASGTYDPRVAAGEPFIHCCRESQIELVGRRYFSGSTGLLLLSIEVERVAAEVKFEFSHAGEESYPHIYGPLNVSAVIEVVAYRSSVSS